MTLPIIEDKLPALLSLANKSEASRLEINSFFNISKLSVRFFAVKATFFLVYPLVFNLSLS